MTGTAGERLRVAVLISGSGTNLQAILDASAQGLLPAEVVGRDELTDTALLSLDAMQASIARCMLAAYPPDLLIETVCSVGRQLAECGFQRLVLETIPGAQLAFAPEINTLSDDLDDIESV